MKKTTLIFIVLIILGATVAAIYYSTEGKEQLSEEYLKAEELADEYNEKNPYEGSVNPYEGPNNIDAAVQGDPNLFLEPIE